MSQLADSLQKKLAELQAEHNQLTKSITDAQTRLNAVSGAIAGIHALLHVDGIMPNDTSMTNGVAQPSNGYQPGDRTPPALYDLITAILADRKQHTVEEVVSVAKNRGVPFGDKDPQKAVAMTLLGISRSKKFKHHPNGTYQRVAD